ncbi:MAG TPA: ATP-binding protein [Aggregatilineaceae bacterium]|nr:ATP-binding protein [Aggregatilineaceae bacterium]
MKWFGNLSLGVKLNALVLTVLGVLLLGVVLLLNRNTENLTKEVGGERIAEEANIIGSRLAEVEDELTVDINFLVSSISFYQAVGNRNDQLVNEIITTANFSLSLDDITVVDGDGKRLVDTDASEDNSEEDRLLMLALSGIQKTELLVETKAGKVEISIAVVAPVYNGSGNNILGATQLSRRLDNAFLKELTFGREPIHLGLIYNDQILARTTPTAKDTPRLLTNGVAFDSDLVLRAQNGQTVVVKGLISGSNGIPHTAAYTPVLTHAASSPAVIMILVDLSEIAAFQNSILVTTIGIFIALTALALAVIYIAIQQTTVRPLQRLKKIAQTITSGQYDERLPVHANDEVGQLAMAFNEMAHAIEQRETSLKAAREQAERADKVKSMFLASMSHELRTPLNAIINLTKFVGLGMYGEVNEEQVDVLKMTEASGKHLLNLINDVLDISKIEAGSLELFVEEGLRIEKIVQLAVEAGRGLLIGKPVAIGQIVEPDLPPITGDEQRVRQIVFNLIANACKFTESGYIAVRAYRSGSEIRVAVSDSGPGIDPEDYDTIFEVFRQAKAGLRKGGGTGLGLPISRRLAEAHGGRLWLESKVGEGATFYVALPIESVLEPTI